MFVINLKSILEVMFAFEKHLYISLWVTFFIIRFMLLSLCVVLVFIELFFIFLFASYMESKCIMFQNMICGLLHCDHEPSSHVVMGIMLQLL
jgi:hypothetical protein